jgi:hypothetical protein
METTMYIAAHNDWWSRDRSAFGQWYVAIPRVNAAAFDAASDPVPGTWLPRSPYKGGTPEHIEYNRQMQAKAEQMAADLNAATKT